MKKVYKYLLIQLLQTFFFALFALCIIFLVVNLLENLDALLDQKVPFKTIVIYYSSQFPEILKLLTPIAMLLACLFSVGKLSNQNEIIAMRTGGMSSFSLLFPFLLWGSFVSLAQLYLSTEFIPNSTKQKMFIERTYLKKNTVSKQFYNLSFRENSSTNILFQYYDSEAKSGSNFSIEYFTSPPNVRIKTRYDAEIVQWDSVNNSWKLSGKVIQRDFDSTIRTTIHSAMVLKSNISNDKLVSLQLTLHELTFNELEEYIELTELGGKKVDALWIDYYGQHAFPFANLIVVIFAVPFASVRKKGGIAVEIATAMVTCFLYMAFTKISQSIGASMQMPHILVAWFANGLFFVAGIFNIKRIK